MKYCMQTAIVNHGRQRECIIILKNTSVKYAPRNLRFKNRILSITLETFTWLVFSSIFLLHISNSLQPNVVIKEFTTDNAAAGGRDFKSL